MASPAGSSKRISGGGGGSVKLFVVIRAAAVTIPAMDIRTCVRYGLFAAPRPIRRKIAARMRSWLARGGPYRARCESLVMELDFKEHSALRFYTDGLIERPVWRLMRDLLRPGMTMADVGANLGFFALSAARFVGPEGRVIAFEPVPGNLRYLRRNLALNPGLANLLVEPLAVSDQEGETTIHLGWHEGNASLLVGARSTTEDTAPVRTTSLDEYAAARDVPRIDLVKMDIEGAERNALLGAARTLREHRPRLAIAAENRPDDQYQIRDLVSRAWSGYRMRCSRCTPQGIYEIRPDVLLFDRQP